ncbi:hypothetical protein [Burkholderia perseverans]|uniref:hypothetical protein n=1 Tax=Burkholderia perseverans TaxID=2615214 RepID=UPI001FEEE662|nr:hypothetical protein [Burkholderia perseverans]
MILEILHLRVTLRELGTHGRDTVRAVDRAFDKAGLDPVAIVPLRRMVRQLEIEIDRGGPLDNPRAFRRPFSDEWSTYNTVRAMLNAAPDEPDPGAAQSHMLPEFRRVSWAELRAAWHSICRRKSTDQTIAQRLVLETVYTRRLIRRATKLVHEIEIALPNSAEAKLLRHILEAEVRHPG